MAKGLLPEVFPEELGKSHFIESFNCRSSKLQTDRLTRLRVIDSLCLEVRLLEYARLDVRVRNFIVRLTALASKITFACHCYFLGQKLLILGSENLSCFEHLGKGEVEENCGLKAFKKTILEAKFPYRKVVSPCHLNP